MAAAHKLVLISVVQTPAGLRESAAAAAINTGRGVFALLYARWKGRLPAKWLALLNRST